MSEKKKKKFYYYDKENDFLEYIEGSEGFFASWVNPHLTLLFPHGCTDLISKNIVGFLVNGIQYIIKKAEEQTSLPLTLEQEEEMHKTMKEMGFKINKEEDKNGN